MFPPKRQGAPPRPKKKTPQIMPRMPTMAAAPVDNEMSGPEEQEPQMSMSAAPGLGRLKNLRAMLMSRRMRR